MNPISFSHLHQHAAPVSPSPVEGFWFTLELQPDLFAPQSFSVGVVVQTKGKGVYCRLLKDLMKFKHIYGHDFPELIVGEMLSQAEEILRQADQKRVDLKQVNFGTDNLKLSKPMSTSGKTVDDIINRLYKNVVILEPLFDLGEYVLGIKDREND